MDDQGRMDFQSDGARSREVPQNLKTKLLLIGIVSVICILLLTVVEIFVLTSPSMYEKKNELRTLAFAFTSICDSLKVHSFATDGTLLGVVRGADIIEHDDDVDMGILKEDLETVLNFCNQKNRWRMKKSCFIRDGSLYSFSHEHTSMSIDVFLFETNTNHQNQKQPTNTFSTFGKCHELWPNSIFEELPWETDYPLGKFDMNGGVFCDVLHDTSISYEDIIADSGFVHVFVHGPVNPVPYLLRMYGSSWRVPVFTHPHEAAGFRKSVLYYMLVLLLFIILSVTAVGSHFLPCCETKI